MSERLFELLRVERAQDPPPEDLLGRNAVIEYKEATQPRRLGARPEGDVLYGVAVREHGGDQDLPEVVQGSVTRLARIIDFI